MLFFHERKRERQRKHTVMGRRGSWPDWTTEKRQRGEKNGKGKGQLATASIRSTLQHSKMPRRRTESRAVRWRKGEREREREREREIKQGDDHGPITTTTMMTTTASQDKCPFTARSHTCALIFSTLKSLTKTHIPTNPQMREHLLSVRESRTKSILLAPSAPTPIL
jgi:hypothetical protein